MAENLLTAPLPAPSAGTAAGGQRPPLGPPPGPLPVPEKFLDPETGQIRVEALLKSYLELERKLSGTMPLPGPDMAAEDRQRLHRALGVPDRPEGYAVSCPHGLFSADPQVNARLHAAGFTPEQAQLVYDLAAERLIPMVQDVAAEFQADRELERLVAFFGGEEKWREMSRQLFAWGKKHLPAGAIEGLSSSFDGIMALYRMMTSDEPAALKGTGGSAPANEAELHGMMRDPRYWRDKDPALIAKVTDGFRRLYPGEG